MLAQKHKRTKFCKPLFAILLNGWPEKHQVPNEVFPYYHHRNEITYHEEILLKNQRIIVLFHLHSEMKSIIHKGISVLKIRKNVLVKSCFDQ